MLFLWFFVKCYFLFFSFCVFSCCYCFCLMNIWRKFGLTAPCSIKLNRFFWCFFSIFLYLLWRTLFSNEVWIAIWVIGISIFFLSQMKRCWQIGHTYLVCLIDCFYWPHQCANCTRTAVLPSDQQGLLLNYFFSSTLYFIYFLLFLFISTIIII